MDSKLIIPSTPPGMEYSVHAILTVVYLILILLGLSLGGGTAVAAPPTVPIKKYPIQGDSVWQSAPLLKVFPSSDPDGDLVSYRHEIYSDAGLTNLLRVWVTSQTFAYVYPALAGDSTNYYWRVRAFDANDSSAWTTASQFVTNFKGWGNTVRVDSRRFDPFQQACSIGVRYSNEIELIGSLLPLEIRSVTGGAYIAPGNWSRGPGPAGRMANSPLLYDPAYGGLWQEAGSWNRTLPTPSQNTCSGPISSSFVTTAALPDFISPDAVYFGSETESDYPEFEVWYLAVGRDGPAVEDASFRLIFNVNSSAGTFVIDTCCYPPSHLNFVYPGPGGEWNVLVPEFTAGTIEIGPCACTCHADPDCDGVQDIIDVINVGNRAFRGFVATIDENCESHQLFDGRTDVDCNGTTDVTDVVKMINVAFRGLSRVSQFCDPCYDD